METPDTYAGMSLAVGSYGWTVREIKMYAKCVSLDKAKELRRKFISSPKYYTFWDAVVNYIGADNG
jgi:hypothetical protein